MKRLETLMLTEMWVDRTDYHHTLVVRGDLPTPRKGEILVAIAKFTMTATNVTYAASVDKFGYWQFYPTGQGHSVGYRRVLASHAEGFAVGERL